MTENSRNRWNEISITFEKNCGNWDILVGKLVWLHSCKSLDYIFCNASKLIFSKTSFISDILIYLKIQCIISILHYKENIPWFFWKFLICLRVWENFCFIKEDIFYLNYSIVLEVTSLEDIFKGIIMQNTGRNMFYKNRWSGWS